MARDEKSILLKMAATIYARPTAEALNIDAAVGAAMDLLRQLSAHERPVLGEVAAQIIAARYAGSSRTKNIDSAIEEARGLYDTVERAPRVDARTEEDA
jgi:hypothetical protein